MIEWYTLTSVIGVALLIGMFRLVWAIVSGQFPYPEKTVYIILSGLTAMAAVNAFIQVRFFTSF